MHVHDRNLFTLFVIAVGGDYHFAKVLLVLNPIQLYLEAGKLGLLNVTFLQQRVHGSNYVLGAGSRRLALEVIEFYDHVSCVNVRFLLLAPLCMQNAGGSAILSHSARPRSCEWRFALRSAQAPVGV